MNLPTVLDAGHTIINLSANQMVQYARLVSLEVMFASYRLLEDLSCRSGGVDAVGLREGPEVCHVPA